jgi:ribokinase
MGKIVVVGSSNTDMVVTTQKMPLPGETLMGNEFSVHQGGKGANQAVAVARAGSEITFIARVGDDDFGRRAIDAYKRDQIDTDSIILDSEQPTGIAMIIVEEETGQNSIVVVGGANQALSIKDIMQVEHIIKEADTVLLQLEIPVEVVESVLRMASVSGVRTILNPAPARSLSDDLLSMVDIITPNETETEMLSGITLEDDGAIEKSAKQLLKKVKEAVIITLGSRGVYMLTSLGDRGFVPTQEVEAVDSTAAGDVFNGYLAAFLGEGLSCREAIKLANRAATISVTRKGAQPSIPMKKELN